MPYKDPIKRKEWNAAWYQKNKERRKAELEAKKTADPTGYREVNKVAVRRWAANNPEKRNEIARRFRMKNPTFFRPSHYKRKYGITLDFVKPEIEAQENTCKICKQRFDDTPHVDHDHDTGKYRAMLDFKCNRGLGSFKDDPAVIFSALLYLVGHKDIPTIS